MGREVVVAITNSKLDFGPWEQIFYGSLMGSGGSAFWSKSLGSSLSIDSRVITKPGDEPGDDVLSRS